jgi:hypothetical protein
MRKERISYRNFGNTIELKIEKRILISATAP